MLTVRLLTATVAGSTSGYRAKALLANMPARKTPEPMRLLPSRPVALKRLTHQEPANGDDWQRITPRPCREVREKARADEEGGGGPDRGQEDRAEPRP